MAQGKLKIGDLARRSGVSPRTIRFYEAAGVFPAPPRGPNGYRLYTAEAAEILRFIQQAQGLGLTLAEIREIVAIRQGGRPPCHHVYQLLKEKDAELDRKLRDLLTLRRRIRQSLAAWGRRPAGAAAICPHIEASLAAAHSRKAEKR